jgi:protein phosphatase
MNVWSITDRGSVRRENQDACYAECDNDKNTALLVVCDGMGGARAGNVASTSALKIVAERLKEAMNSGETPLSDSIKAAVETANEAVYRESVTNPDCAGMGTTMVGAVVKDGHVTVFNVGDSRAYVIRQRSIKRVTVDHSVVEELVLRGDITREQSVRHPSKNLITRAIGTEPDVECDIFYPKLRAGDYLLLCSDGLTNVVSDREIMDEVIKGGAPDNCCERLVETVLRRGAPDNVTVVLFRK